MVSDEDAIESRGRGYRTSDAESEKKKTKYFEMLRNEEFYLKTAHQQARDMGVSWRTIRKWRVSVDWEKLAIDYRKAYARHYPEIDMALIKNAKRGKEKSIELFYKRFEGWSDRSGLDITVRKEFAELDNEALVAELVKEMSDEKRKALLDGKGPVIEVEAKSEETQG